MIDPPDQGKKNLSPSGDNDLREAEKLFKEFLTLRDSGNSPDPDDFLRRHQAHREELRKLLDSIRDEPAPEIDLLEEAKASSPAGPGSRPRVLGDFKILQKIGAGGMGTVYEAEQISLRRRVALKILPAHLEYSDKAVQKFHREAEAGGRQSHPGIVSIYAVGEHEGAHYIAQELVEGGRTLADRLAELRDEGGQPPGYFREAARLVAEVADALQHAHESGVIHRDVKPSNILLAANGHPKVTDFGLARVEDALALSRTGDFAGTPYYMSPEQAASRRMGIDKRTDVYSLGVTLYEMLTLELPFKGDTSQEVIKKILLHEPRDPRRVSARVPRDLAVICLKAMEKKPEARYASMREFVDDLRRYLSGDVILAKPAGPGAKLLKRMKRNPALSTAVGVALAAILAWVVLGPVFLLQIQRERDAANFEKNEANIQRDRADREKRNAEEAEKETRKALEEVQKQRNATKEALTKAEKSLTRSEGLRLAAQSSIIVDSDPSLALLLACKSAERSPGLFSNNALVKALLNCRERKTLIHGGWVHHAAFSPDGRKVVTACENSVARIWDVAAGEIIVSLEGHKNSVRQCSFSPDGKKVVTRSSDKTARVWNAVTGECLFVLEVPQSSINTAFFSPDGNYVLAASSDNRARIWDSEEGDEVVVFEGHKGDVLSARFSPDGRQVVTASDDKTARIWDSLKGDEFYCLAGHLDKVNDALFSSDGKKVITASSDRTARIWETETGAEGAVLVGHSGRMESASFSFDGTRALTVSENEIRVWDTATGKNLSVLDIKSASIYSAEFSPDGRSVVTASFDETARIWDSSTGNEIAVFNAHEGEVRTAEFSPDGNYVVTASTDETARIWDAVMVLESLGHETTPERCYAADFSPDGSRVVMVSEDGILQLRDATTGSEIFSSQTSAGNVLQLKFSPSGGKIAVTCQEGSTRIWDVKAGRETASLDGHTAVVVTAHFSPDSSKVVTASIDGTARIWDTATGAELRRLEGHSGPLIHARFCPKGDRVITAGFDGIARIWDAVTGDEIMVLKGHRGQIDTANFSPDGQKAVTVSWYGDQTTRIWDVATGEEIICRAGCCGGPFRVDFSADGENLVHANLGDGKTLLSNVLTGEVIGTLDGPETSPLVSMEMSPDGLKAATGSLDGTVTIWNVTTGAEIARLEGHKYPVVAVRFSPDGKRVITESLDPYNDGDVASTRSSGIWDAVTGEAIFFSGERAEKESKTGQSLSAERKEDILPSRAISTLVGHEGPLRSIHFSSDGLRVVTASDDRTARIWEVASGIELLRITADSPIMSAFFSPDSRKVVTTSKDTMVRVWDATSGEMLSILEIMGEPVHFARFSPDGERLLTSGGVVPVRKSISMDGPKTPRIWKVADGKEIVALKGHEGPVFSAHFSPDGLRVVTSSDDKTARVWDAVSGTQIATMKGHVSRVLSACFNPDGKQVVTGAGLTKSVRIWNAATGEEIKSPVQSGDVRAVQFSPDGEKVLIEYNWGGETVTVWKTTPGEEKLISLNGHEGAVYTACFSPDSTKVVTVSEDQTARIWDAETGEEIVTLKGHRDSVLSGCFSPDGQKVGTVSADGTAMIWPVDLLGAADRQKPRELFMREKKRFDIQDPEDRQAMTLVNRLFNELILSEDVIAHLREDPALTEPVREAALRHARARGDNWIDLINATRKLIDDPDGTEASYRSGLKKATALYRLMPEEGLLLFGMSQYRVGNYEKALPTLIEAEKCEAKNEENKLNWFRSLSFIAMTQHKLGQATEAETSLGRLRELMKDRRFADNAIIKASFQEAEELIAGSKEKKPMPQSGEEFSDG